MTSPTLHFDIPDISDERLVELTQRIRPVVLNPEDDQYWFIKLPDLRGVSFIWAPEYDTVATGLVQIGVIPTLHTWGYYGLFKPSIAEVMKMIPHTAIDQVTAFEVDGPKNADDLNAQSSVVNGGYHLALTTLYTNRPEEGVR